ncbi:glycosyltransferase [Pedobacter sp. R20-19]|uniref:glycosyltransferase n=1 Tax=Pedobacter sp. R20-19 TaxID=1270196 RepID=UPI00068A4F04|nr:glycosyltransferase [Pedobacter sp. R20-19]
MISIIISSANDKYLTDINQNINQTIGVPFEIISVDNSKGESGICRIYNEGAKNAKFEILCYMHEDLKILTQDWGLIVIDIFKKNNKIGVLGVVGSAYKSISPSGWGAESKMNLVKFSNYIQSYKHLNKASELIYYNPTNTDLANVVTVDGMWICTTRQVARDNPFDEKLLTGFHCYDIDFCLSAGRKHDIAVTFSILMEHFSEGTYTRGWVEDTIKVHDKFMGILPLSTVAIEEDELYQIEKRAFRLFIEKLVNMDYSINFIQELLLKYYRQGKIPSMLFYKLSYYIYKYFLFKKKA